MHFSLQLRDWKVGTRLTVGFGLILTLLMVVAILGFTAIHQARALHETFKPRWCCAVKATPCKNSWPWT